jgi:translation initiation factor 2 alpha subunit (eIF-2alpha)
MPFYSSTTIETTTAPKYEYKVVEVHLMAKESGDIETYLNKLGEEGWQMVQNDGGKATFMREKGVEDE